MTAQVDRVTRARRTSAGRIAPRCRALVAACIAAGLSAQTVAGSTWTFAGSGTWQTASNWLGGVPTSSTSAVFTLNSTYTVSPSANTAAASLAVNAGFVSFNLGSTTLTVVGTTTVAINATLSLPTGTLVTGSLNSSSGGLSLADSTLSINGGALTPRQSQVTIGTSTLSTAYQTCVNISGNAGATARPTLALLAGGTVSLNNGTAASDSSIFVGINGGNGAILVDGTSSKLTTAASSGNIFIGAGSTLSGAYKGDGILNLINGGQASSRYDTVIGDAGGSGVVTVEGAPSKLAATGNLYVGRSRYSSTITKTDGAGTLLLTNGGQASATIASISSLGGRGTVLIGNPNGSDTGGTRFAATTIKLCESNGSITDSGGTLSIYAGGTVETDSILSSYTTNADAARINLAGGTLKTGSLSLGNSMHLNFTAGTLWLTGGTTTTGGAITLGTTAAATLKGSGTIAGGHVTTRGTISPGDNNSIASFSLGNSLAIGTTGTDAATGTFAVDVDYATNTADRLLVTGTVSLANAVLKVNAINFPIGQLGTAKTFILIQNDATDFVTGTFSSDLFAGLVYTITPNYTGTAVNGTGDGNDVAITFTSGYVPEPAAILVLAAAFITPRRRRLHLARSLATDRAHRSRVTGTK